MRLQMEAQVETLRTATPWQGKEPEVEVTLNFEADRSSKAHALSGGRLQLAVPAEWKALFEKNVRVTFESIDE